MRKATCILPGLLMMLPVGGCSLFRQVRVSRQDSLQTVHQKASFDWKIDSTRLLSRVFSFTDSSGAEFDVEIVPSGPFTFSPRGGFAGSGSLVRLRGKSQSRMTAVDSSRENMQIRSRGSLVQNVKIKTSTKELKKEKVGVNKLWWLLALVFVCLVMIVSIRKVRTFL